MRICNVEGCNRLVNAKGYCDKHYKRFKKYGDPLIVKLEINHNRDPICTIEGCNNPHEAKGYCRKHYVRFKKSGNPLFKKTEYHGMRNTYEYSVWSSMKDRCLNKNNKGYYRYGGRGITVCDRWLNSFIAFHEDMGQKPFSKAQLDRRDNDGNYEPDNCRWVTPAVNANNRRPRNKNI